MRKFISIILSSFILLSCTNKTNENSNENNKEINISDVFDYYENGFEKHDNVGNILSLYKTYKGTLHIKDDFKFTEFDVKCDQKYAISVKDTNNIFNNSAKINDEKVLITYDCDNSNFIINTLNDELDNINIEFIFDNKKTINFDCVYNMPGTSKIEIVVDTLRYKDPIYHSYFEKNGEMVDGHDINALSQLTGDNNFIGGEKYIIEYYNFDRLLNYADIFPSPTFVMLKNDIISINKISDSLIKKVKISDDGNLVSIEDNNPILLATTVEPFYYGYYKYYSSITNNSYPYLKVHTEDGIKQLNEFKSGQVLYAAVDNVNSNHYIDYHFKTNIYGLYTYNPLEEN